MFRYLLKIKDAESGAVLSERQFRTLKEAQHFYEKAESAAVIFIGDYPDQNKVLLWK
jgi:hypothetical protein